VNSLAPFAYYDPELFSSRTSLDFSVPSNVPPTDAYAAGLIDGEGCIYISRERSSYSLRVDTGMSAKALPLMEDLRNEYGGSVVKAREEMGKWAAAYKWAISGEAAASMLQRLLPALRLKRPQAELALQMWALREQLPLRGRNGRRRWTDEALRSVGEMKMQMQSLNRKGPAPAVVGGWVSAQNSLLETPESRSSLVTWPRSGIAHDGAASERLTSGLPTDASESSSLLPTPSAYESTPTDEFSDEVRESLTDPHKRLYLPGRKWHAQRTLARMAGALLPTPSANDHTGSELETRQARQEDGNTGGPSLRDLPKLLPTPVVTDSYGSRRSTARTDEWTSNEGTSLTDAIWETQGRETDTKGNLLPTPSARDRKGRSAREPHRSDNGKLRSDRERPLSDIEELLPADDQLLPTPRVTSERNSRKAMVENDQWSSVSLAQATELAQGILPREFKSWDEVPGSLGASTKPPSSAGKRSSGDPLPGQLTIEDA
jgi:hypothetical protein